MVSSTTGTKAESVQTSGSNGILFLYWWSKHQYSTYWSENITQAEHVFLPVMEYHLYHHPEQNMHWSSIIFLPEKRVYAEYRFNISNFQFPQKEYPKPQAYLTLFFTDCQHCKVVETLQ
jgi:hypothetical protein